MEELKSLIAEKLHKLDVLEFNRLKNGAAIEIAKEYFHLESHESDINPFRSFANHIYSPEHLENFINGDRGYWNEILTEVIYELEFYAQQVRYFATIKDPKDKPGTTKVKIKALNYKVLNLPELDPVWG